MTTIAGLNSLTSSGRMITYPNVLFEIGFYGHGAVSYTAQGKDPLTGRQTSDVIRLDTHKSIHQPMGTWSMTLVPRLTDWFKMIQPGDWCQIKVDVKDKQGPRMLMYGPVTSIRRRRATDEKGAVQTAIQIDGADFGAAVSKTTALLDQAIAGDPAFSNLGWAASAIRNINTVTGNPAVIVKALIDHYFGTGIPQWFDPQTGAPFVNGVDTKYVTGITADPATRADMLGESVFQPVVLSSPLWQVLEQWANLSVNELFVDYRPPISNPNDLINLVPAIVLRRQPLFGTDWNNLTNVPIDHEECISEDLGRNDQDVMNWIRAMDDMATTGYPQGNIAVYQHIGVINGDSVKRFGIRRHEPTTLFTRDIAAKPPKSIPKVIEEHTGWMAQWHHSNELLYSGTLTTYIRPDVRVGYRLDYTDRDSQQQLQFYIEEVSHSWQYPGRSTTSLTVTRGRDPNNTYMTQDLSALETSFVLTPIGNTIIDAMSVMSGKL